MIFLVNKCYFGGIIGSLIPINFKIRNEITAIIFLILFDSLLFLTFTFIKIYYLSVFIFMFFGIMTAVTLVLVETKIQNEIESPYRPFAFSIMQFSSGALGASAAVIAGILSDSFGTAKILRYSANIEILTGIIMLLMIFIIRKREYIIKINPK